MCEIDSFFSIFDVTAQDIVASEGFGTLLIPVVPWVHLNLTKEEYFMIDLADAPGGTNNFQKVIFC